MQDVGETHQSYEVSSEVTTVTNTQEMQFHSLISKILTSNEDDNNNTIEKGNSAVRSNTCYFHHMVTPSAAWQLNCRLHKEV